MYSSLLFVERVVELGAGALGITGCIAAGCDCAECFRVSWASLFLGRGV